MVMENVTSTEEEATGKGDKRRMLEVAEGPDVRACQVLDRDAAIAMMQTADDGDRDELCRI